MHALEVIIARNLEAAGREAAHAYLDGDRDTLTRIRNARDVDVTPFGEKWAAYWRGYTRGLRE